MSNKFLQSVGDNFLFWNVEKLTWKMGGHFTLDSDLQTGIDCQCEGGCNMGESDY